MKIDAEHWVIDFTFHFYTPEAIVYFQFHPAVAALGSYGAVNLETENKKRNPKDPVNPV
jgi:hypothetical protein